MEATMTVYLIGFTMDARPVYDDGPRPSGHGWANIGSSWVRFGLQLSDGQTLVGPPIDEVRAIAMGGVKVTTDDLAKSGALHLFAPA